MKTDFMDYRVIETGHHDEFQDLQFGSTCERA
jgi:hypothetical protein